MKRCHIHGHVTGDGWRECLISVRDHYCWLVHSLLVHGVRVLPIVAREPRLKVGLSLIGLVARGMGQRCCQRSLRRSFHDSTTIRWTVIACPCAAACSFPSHVFHVNDAPRIDGMGQPHGSCGLQMSCNGCGSHVACVRCPHRCRPGPESRPLWERGWLLPQGSSSMDAGSRGVVHRHYVVGFSRVE